MTGESRERHGRKDGERDGERESRHPDCDGLRQTSLHKKDLSSEPGEGGPGQRAKRASGGDGKWTL